MHVIKAQLTARRWLWLAGLLLALLGAVPTAAQDQRVPVRVDGRTIFRVGPSADSDAQTRAQRIEQRINTLLENPEAIAPVVTGRTAADELVLTIAGVPIVTISAADAADNITTMDALATQWASVLNDALTRARQVRLGSGGRFVGSTRSSVETAFTRLGEGAITIIPRAFAALLVLLFFWLLATAVRWLMRLIFRRFIADLTVENLLRQLAYYAVWVLGLIIAVYALGFDVQAVATGLGLTSLALGFALKDILSNFVSGMLILTLRPFRLGDQIVIGATEGSVERIELRATQIRTYDGRVVLVPNAEVFTSRITNNTAAPIRRGSVELFLGYDSDLPQAVAAISAATQATDGVLAEPPVEVRVRELGADDIIIEIRFWTDSERWDFIATASAVRTVLVQALKQAHIGLPDPDVRILVPRAPDQWRAIFDPAQRTAAD